jgi:xylan 1,4-beta-xylosidase
MKRGSVKIGACATPLLPVRVDDLARRSYHGGVRSQFAPITYERIHHERELPFRCFFNSVRYVGSHWHAELELLMQIRGQIAVSFPDGVTVLRRRDLVLANPFEVHSIVGRSTDTLTLALQIDLTDPVLLPRHHTGRRFRRVADWPPELAVAVRAEMTTVAQELSEQRDGFPLACLSSLAALLTLLVRGAGAPAEVSDTSEDLPGWFDRVRRVISYLQEHYTRRVSLDEIADHVGLSRYYTSHLVKAATGLSIQENQGLIRTNRAVHLMFTTDARLVDIAMDAGFSHLKYFNKYFRRLYGETPSHARNRQEWREAVISGSSDRVQSPSPPLVSMLTD